MKPLRLSDVVAATAGRLTGGLSADRQVDGNLPVTGVSTDTRTIKPGDVFVALRGDRYDGHAFVGRALASGASAVIIDDERALLAAAPPPSRGEEHTPGARATSGPPAVVVRDTLEALGRLAAAYRRMLSVTVVGVTGSNGKTTTKEMIGRALARRAPTACSVKSYNNHIGVPLSVLAIEPEHHWAVLEMGTSAPGEIRGLAAIARPDLGVVTTISETHLAGLGGVEGVARAKGELIEALPPEGTAVLNMDEPLCAALSALSRGHVVYFGRTRGADVWANNIRRTPEGVAFRLNGRRPVRLRLLGVHNALNALAAIAVCRRLGLAEDDILTALEDFSAVPMRLQVLRADGVTVLDDSYNANPQSMRGALESLAAHPCPGRRVAVLGDMRELGDASHRLHRDLGLRAAEAGLHVLVTVGEEARLVGEAAAAAGLAAEAIHHCPSADDAVALVTALVRPGDLILVKGSRAMGLERVVRAITEEGSRIQNPESRSLRPAS